jgi:hypothetical protein
MTPVEPASPSPEARAPGCCVTGQTDLNLDPWPEGAEGISPSRYLACCSSSFIVWLGFKERLLDLQAPGGGW